MGRSNRQTADYFPHYVGEKSRTKFILEKNWGNDGYAFWFKLLELLCAADGQYYDCWDKMGWEYLLAVTGVTAETAEAILNTLASMGKVDKELWESCRVIWVQSLIHQANSNSMSGKRGDISAHEYEVYCQKVMSWNIPDSRKQKIVDQIYAKWSEQLRHEAAHVSVAVAGPARYNAKKLDHSDTILRLSSEFVEWFNGLQEQVWQGRIEDKDAKEIARLVDDIKFCIERPTLNPTESLCELANKDPELFMEYYEKLHEKYRWRKNSVIAKLYAAGKEGKNNRLARRIHRLGGRY